MNVISPIDAAFVRMESLRTPMHIGGLLVFRLPDGAGPEFLRELLDRMRTRPFMPPPFNCRLKRDGLHRFLPAWEETDFDIDYHVRHSALPWPGGERELGVLVARLHSHPLDLTRPPWECHLIEGLEHHRFALYFKAHHCAVDGMAAMRLVGNWMTEDASDMSGPTAGRPPVQPRPARVSLKTRLLKPVTFANRQIRSLPDLVHTLILMSQPGQEGGVRAAMATPRSLFNVPVSQQRRLGTQLLDLARVKAVARTTGTTVNDVCLSLCGAAMRRYLNERGALPEKSLLASVPVGLQRPENQSGNAVAGFVCPLGTHVEEPLRRLRVVHEVCAKAKEQLHAMSPDALAQFTLLGLSPLILGQMTGTLAKLPPFFNVTVSNVVVSKVPLYLRGAQLEAMYPMSILFDGYALNVTLVGYNDCIAIGFTGCRNAIPSLQRLAVYTGEALPALEAAVGLAKSRHIRATASPAKKTARRSRKSASEPPSGRKQ